MSNRIDPKMISTERTKAELVLKQIPVDGMSVRYIEATKALQFKLDRRVVTVPTVLIDENHWPEIRHLFRAILSQAPAVMNTQAPNDWGPHNNSYKV